MICLVIDLEGTFDIGEAEDLDDALVEGNGLGNDITEVSPFLGPCAEMGHDVVGCKDIVGHVSCVCVYVIDVAIIICLMPSDGMISGRSRPGYNLSWAQKREELDMAHRPATPALPWTRPRIRWGGVSL